MKVFICILTLFPFLSFAQWEKPSQLSGQSYGVTFEHQEVLYTGSDSIVYYRENTSSHWNILKTFPKKVYFSTSQVWNEKLYLGSAKGLYSYHVDNGSWEGPFLSGSYISSIVEYNNTLWVSTQGHGVYKWNPSTQSFHKVTQGMYAQNISKLLVTTTGLYAFTEANGVFYHYQPENAKWESRLFFGDIFPEFGVGDAISFEGKLWVSSLSSYPYQQETAQNWLPVAEGLPRGMNGLFYKTEDQLFLLVNTRAYSCRIFVLSNDRWQECTEELKDAYAYGFARLGSAFYLSTDQGLYYWQEPVLGERPTPHQNQKWLLTNPLNHSMLELSSHSSVEKAEIYSLNGGLMWHKEYPKSQEIVNMPNGMYILYIYTKGRTYQEKLLIKN